MVQLQGYMFTVALVSHTMGYDSCKFLNGMDQITVENSLEHLALSLPKKEGPVNIYWVT